MDLFVCAECASEWVSIYPPPALTANSLASPRIVHADPTPLHRGVQGGLAHIILNHAEDLDALQRFARNQGNMVQYYIKDGRAF